MSKKFKVIREQVKQVIIQHKAANDNDGNPATKNSNDKSDIKSTSFGKHDSKKIQTNLAGKQKEPNRGEGASRHPGVPKAHVTRPTNERAEIMRHHPTHKLISDSGSEVKIGSAVRGHGGTTHVVDKLVPSKFGGAADRVETHSTENPALHGSFHPKDIGVKMVKRTVKEGRESETAANRMLAQSVKNKGDESKSRYDNAYHDYVHASEMKRKEAKKKLDAARSAYFKEDIGMAAGAAGDPGAVRSPEANYAAQKARGVKVKSLMRRKKPKC